ADQHIGFWSAAAGLGDAQGPFRSHANRLLVAGAAVAVVVDVVKEGQQAIVVLLRDRVDLVIMAAGAVERQAKEHLAGRRHDVVQSLITGLLGVGRLVVPDAQAIVAGCNQGVGPVAGQLVASQLLADKLVIGLVLVERADDIIAVAP